MGVVRISTARKNATSKFANIGYGIVIISSLMITATALIVVDVKNDKVGEKKFSLRPN